MKKTFLEGLELINKYLSTFKPGLYGQNKWKEKILTSTISTPFSQSNHRKKKCKRNEGPPLHPERKQACSPAGACQWSPSAQGPGPRPHPGQACGATQLSGARSRSSWERAGFLASQSVSGMNNPWRSRCISTSMDARANSVKLLASRISRKGSFWGSVDTMADRIIPLGNKKRHLVKIQTEISFSWRGKFLSCISLSSLK